MSDLVKIVNDTIQYKRYDREFLENYIKTHDPKFKELDLAFEYVIRSKKMTSNKEKAFCFLVLYNAIRSKSQVPLYPDPKVGCAPKKINDISEFIEYNRNSVFEFIGELETLVNS